MTTAMKKTLARVKKALHLYKPRNWEDIEHFDEAWKARIACMARLIDRQSTSVVDVGCGPCWLKDILPAGVAYTGVDYKPRAGANNIVCNLNAGEFPQVAGEVVFCSGTLEYLEDLPAFVGRLGTIAGQAIVSYCGTDFTHSDVETRASLGWKNHLSSLDLIDLFLSHGFCLVAISREIPGNLILKLRKP